MHFLALMVFFYLYPRGSRKKRIFYDQAVSVDPPNPNPQLTVSFSWFFLGCGLDPRQWKYVFWNGFYTRKRQFIHLLDDYLQEASLSGWSFATTNRAWKMHFWDPSQWDEMCFEYQRITFQWKNGSNFHVCLRSAWP